MVLKTYTLLLSAVHLILCHPAPKDTTLPRVNVSNPYEINNLNYYNADTDPEPEESKLFRRTVSNFEKSVNYIDKTVKEVESLLNANSTLPRLTRGEILEIIENITQADLQQEVKINKTQGRDQKAIMLVMPYTPDNADEEKMQELFTKPPVTRIIGEAPKPSQVEVKPTNKRRRRPFPQTPQGGFYGEVFPEPLPERTAERKPTRKPEKTPILNFNLEPPLHNHKLQVFTQKPLTLATTDKPKATKPTQPIITTYKPFLKISTTEKTKHRRASPKPFTTSTEISVVINNYPSTTTKFPQRKRRPSKSPQRHPNHKYPEESQAAFVNQGLKLVESPKLSPVYPTSTEFTTRRNIGKFAFTTVAPAKSSRPHPFTAADPILPSINLPDDLKATLDDLNLGDSFNEKPIKYEPDATGYIRPPPLKDNVKDILASIGVLPSTTTTTSIPDISNVADTLSPDMKQLLMSFGLIPDPNYKPEVVKEETSIGVHTAEVNPNSYVQFKPLPDSGPTRDDMEEFLGRFGLGKSSKSTRNQKALNVNKPGKVLTDVPHIQEGMVPDYMRDVLIDLGLTDRQGKKIRAQSFRKTVDKSSEELKSTTEKQHVFSPLETSHSTKDELEKLNQLLDIIKELEKLNGTATENDLNKLDLKNLKDLVGSLNKDEFAPLDEQEWAPDPLNDDYGVNKNEVKRQQNSSSTTEIVVTVTPVASTTPSTTTTTTTTTTTEQPNSAAIKDLEDSFGGSSDTGPPATLPPPTEAPKTGYYYLLDWNTFLDIDDQKGKRVNLRFQPKVGDAKQFFSVNVP